MFMNEKMDMPNVHSKESVASEMKAHEMPMMDHNPCCDPICGSVCPPVYECPQERCCHREIIHEVPHIQPINTRVINHHIYRHSCTPCYTCCEENVCSNIIVGPCCK